MLWDLFKELDREDYPIYLEKMSEDKNSQPSNYIIFQDDVTDQRFSEGDGVSLFRRKTYRIRIFAKDTRDLNSVVNSYRSILIDNKIAFTQFGPEYNPVDDCMLVVFTGSYIYGSI